MKAFKEKSENEDENMENEDEETSNQCNYLPVSCT